jgi:capsular polysaccharide biosynthesis protein
VLRDAVERLERRQAPAAELARARADLDRARALADLAATEAAAATVLDGATGASRVDAPPFIAAGLVLVALAAAVAAALVVWAEGRDRTVRDELDVTDTTGRPVLAVVEGR